ncbi:MAG: hypothetical protein OEY56_02670 [Cyclobacteriaceae bacterium]|nr:hypothetical protein [Cyclobacteriaceae bacterium]
MNDKGLTKYFENWKVVLLSLMGATTFWFFNALNKEYGARIKYPIEFIFNRDSVVLMDPLPETITLEVSSGGWNLFRRTLWFSVDPIQIELDNPAEIKYLTRSSLMPEVSAQLDGLDINYLISDTLFINIERKISKKVTIQVDSINISLADNYRIISPIRIDPPEVTLWGPEPFISSLETEYYVMVPEARINKSLKNILKVPLPFDELMSAYPAQIEVSFEVDKFEKKTTKIQLELLNFPQQRNFTLSDTIVDVSFVVGASQERLILPSDFVITLDFLMMNKEDSSIEPSLIHFPEFLENVNVSPATIRLVYEK